MRKQPHALLLEFSKLQQTLSITQQLHAFIIKTPSSYDPFYATRILRFYANNSCLVSARNLFDETPHRTVYLWNSIIRAYARVHEFSEAFSLFKRMLCSGTKPDNFTFACMLRACAESCDLQRLRPVHGLEIVSGLGKDSICTSSLVTAYSKLGLIDEASWVFYIIPQPDSVLWNAIISGYGCCGYWYMAIELFNLSQKKGNRPDGYTLVGLISGLLNPGLLEIGQGVHVLCVKNGLESNAHVASVLVSMYSRYNCMKSACRIFDSLVQPDLVTWSALITGFSQCGEYGKALEFFKRMIVEGGKADPVLIASVLRAAAELAIVAPGSEIHAYAVRHELDLDIMVSSALIDMYSKSGFLGLGSRIFDIMPQRSIISYNSMISALGLYGLAHRAFEMFDGLIDKGYKPDESTFSALLSACCHAGLTNSGREYFRIMKDEFDIHALPEHYVYMVKLVGMAGELEEAYDLIRSLPEPADSGIWGALLWCCEFHGNLELAVIVSQRLSEKNPDRSSYKVMLSNIYAGDGKWNQVKKLRDGMTGVKLTGLSWIGS